MNQCTICGHIGPTTTINGAELCLYHAHEMQRNRAMLATWRKASNRFDVVRPCGFRKSVLETMMVSESGKVVEFWYNDHIDSTHLAVEAIA